MTNQNYSASSTSSEDLFQVTPVVYGGFGERFGAALIDGLILVVVSVIMRYIVNYETGIVISIVINWLYYAFQESSEAQATIGKKALKLRVTSIEGRRISFGQATGRFFGKYISAVILLIGYLMMLWDDKKQTLHDKMAGTLVVKAGNQYE